MLDTPEKKIWFEQIYQKYRGLMYHVADSILHNSQDAEDAVQNVFLRIIKNFSRFQNAPAQDMAPHLVVIVKNEAISVLRKKKDTAPLEDWDGPAETSEDIADYHALVDSFTRLPQIYRAIMEMKMKLLSGYSDGEIVAKLNPSKTAVREALIKSKRADRRADFLPAKAKNCRNTLCISRFFNEDRRKICRRDVCGDLFSGSFITSAAALLLASSNKA